jgi:hypothetical protein
MELGKYLKLDKHGEDAVQAMRETCDTLERRLCDGPVDLSHVWNSIEDECHLSEAGWDLFFSSIDGVEGDEVANRLTEAFQDCQLNGLEIAETPVPKGKAVPARKFAAWLDESETFTTASMRDRFLDAIRYREPLPDQSLLHDLPLGNHLIWSTFHEDEEDPFSPFTTAQEIRTGLGLPPPERQEDDELILLVYALKDNVTVRYPTIADAYATEDSWNPEFQCSKPGDEWGYTSGGRPEVVHEVIEGECLVVSDEDDAYSVLALRTVR